jgi:hypothetical protein
MSAPAANPTLTADMKPAPKPPKGLPAAAPATFALPEKRDNGDNR